MIDEKPQAPELVVQEPSKKSTLRRRILLSIGLPLWVFAGFFLAQVLLVAVITGLRETGVSLNGLNEAVLNAALAAIVYLLTLGIVIWLPVQLKKTTFSLKSIGLDRLPNWQDLLLAPAGFVVYILLSAILLAVVVQAFPGFNSDQAQDVGFQGISKQYEYILAFVTLVVIAPVAEEILMRGYLYGRLKKLMGVPGAMILTAAVFGALHMQWNVALDVFALSLVLTSLREVSGSIWAGILLHMLKNGLAFYLLFINPVLFHTIGG